MSNSGYNTMSTIMVPIILSTIQHHRETSYNNSQYTTYIQRYASNHSILMTIEISRYLSLYSALGPTRVLQPHGGGGNICCVLRIKNKTRMYYSIYGRPPPNKVTHPPLTTRLSRNRRYQRHAIGTAIIHYHDIGMH